MTFISELNFRGMYTIYIEKTSHINKNIEEVKVVMHDVDVRGMSPSSVRSALCL